LFEFGLDPVQMIGSVFSGLQVFLFLLATFGPKLLLLLKLGNKLLLKTFIFVEGFFSTNIRIF
jgi:hypothetical protein